MHSVRKHKGEFCVCSFCGSENVTSYRENADLYVICSDCEEVALVEDEDRNYGDQSPLYPTPTFRPFRPSENGDK